MQKEKPEAKAVQRHLRASGCGSHLDTCVTVKGMLARKISGIDQRLGYLANLPWTLVRADTVEGAKIVMEQVRSLPLEQHGDFTF